MFLASFMALVLGWWSSEASNNPRMWGQEGVVVAEASGDQYRPAMSAGSSSVVVAWQDDRADSAPDLGWQIMAKGGLDILPLSQTVWQRQGIQSEPVVLASRTGRCTLVWKESSNGVDWGIWFQDFNLASGVHLDPAQVAPPNGSCSNLQIAIVANSDVAILWEASGEDGSRDLRLARVNRSGNVIGVITACDHEALTSDASLVVNGSLAFVVWTDWRSGAPAIYGQCWDVSSDAMLWPKNGMLLSPSAVWAQTARAFASDEGYLGLTYWTQADGRATLEMQIVDYQQNFRFFPPLVITAPEFTGENDAIPNLAGGAVVGWIEGDSLFAQARDFSGQVAWTTCVTSHAASPRDVQLVGQSDGVDVVWREDVQGNHRHVLYAQRLTLTGTPQWQGGGVRLSNGNGGQENASAVSAFDGSLVVAWEDHRDPLLVRVAMQRMN